jgi:prepilin-type N-terminal cleavage/methylation domain-containing protein
MRSRTSDEHEKGFTLIEIMIAIAIIGILAMIAIPQFMGYSERSRNTAAQSDLRNAVTAQEAYFLENKIYAGSVDNLKDESYGLYMSGNVSVTVLVGDGTGYTMQSYHGSGDKTWIMGRPRGAMTGM